MLACKRLRSAYEEWRDAVDDGRRRPSSACMLPGSTKFCAPRSRSTTSCFDAAATVSERSAPCRLPEHGATIAPDLAFVDPTHGDELLTAHPRLSARYRLSASMKFDGLCVLARRSHGAASARDRLSAWAS